MKQADADGLYCNLQTCTQFCMRHLGSSAGWGNPDGFGVRVSTGQGAGQRLMTRDPDGSSKSTKKREKRSKNAFFDGFSRFFVL
jgi:hypothetical protein